VADDLTPGMRVVSRHVDGLRHVFRIIVPAHEIHERAAAQLRVIGERIRVPGFRPGKVPLAIVRERYGAAVTREVTEQAIKQSSERALSEHGIQPALAPIVEVMSSVEGGDLEFSLTVDSLPEVPTVDIGALELEQLTAEITERDVDLWLPRVSGGPRTENDSVDLEARRQATREQLDREVIRLARAAFKRQLFDRLAATHDFPVPQTLVDREFDLIWKAVESTRSSRADETAGPARTYASVREEYRAIAERRVRLGLLLTGIGRRHNIEAVGSSALLEDRVVDLIGERARVVRRVVPLEDLMAQGDR
jgi:FKBP-type peptidyl-prolyl cis-trans isomerase (trigger factor)